MKTYLVTGATRGLGLAIAKSLQRTDKVIVAVRDVAKARALGFQDVHSLNLASLSDVQRFVGTWSTPITGLINNAGIQHIDQTRITAEGLEETFAVNHLGSHALTLGLLPVVKDTVLFVGSGTQALHSMGFRGARYTSIEALARGDTDAPDIKQAGLDRYATTKFLNTISALGLSARHPDKTFLCIDPGLMPGTGLARSYSLPMRIVWSSVMRLAVPFMADTSSPARSAATVAWLLHEKGLKNGATYSYTRELAKAKWLAPGATDPVLAEKILADTDAFLESQARVDQRLRRS